MINQSHFDAYDDRHYRIYTNPLIIEKDLQTLVGILEGIRCDAVMNDIELNELHHWLDTNKEYESKQPYKEVITTIRTALSDDILTEDEIQNIIWYCKQYINRSAYFNDMTAGIQKLNGLIKGITIDGEVNDKELHFLDNWLEENEYLKNTYPYDEVYNMITSILKDKVISPEERDEFLKFASALVGTNHEESNAGMIESLNTGFFQIDPQIIVQEKYFCITGESKKFKRREIGEKIELFGGFTVDGISSKVNYLIVCDERNACWTFTCYGRKIEQAIKLRKKGANLVIVHEYDLYDTLESL